MIQMNFGPYLASEVERRQEELRREMEQVRLADKITRADFPRAAMPSKVLTGIGKQLINIGTNLQQRYSQGTVEASTFEQTQYPEGC